jgi:glycosyltransferase involved in cell wall biosynthesis
MKIVIVIHEATRTGAPRIGGLIASVLRRSHDVRIVCLKNGPLWQWLEDRVDVGGLELVDRGPVNTRTFDERVQMAVSYLRRQDADMVYVNSLAASEYLVAAKMLDKKAVLHLHEKNREIHSLLSLQITKLNILLFCDGVILAGDDLEHDMVESFGMKPQHILKWGIAVDFAEIERLATRGSLLATNILGEPLVPSEKVLIGMVGHASKRKGSDIFLAVAEALPDQQFIWVGNWHPSDAPENLETHERLVRGQLKNVYMTGGVDNPYRYIKEFDLFFLSSREDPNPVALAEALSLRVPTLCFSNTTAVTDFLGQAAILLHGNPDGCSAARIIGKLDKAELRSESLCPSRDAVRSRFGIESKAALISDFLSAM